MPVSKTSCGCVWVCAQCRQQQKPVSNKPPMVAGFKAQGCLLGCCLEFVTPNTVQDNVGRLVAHAGYADNAYTPLPCRPAGTTAAR
jgi:hypothetical protein